MKKLFITIFLLFFAVSAYATTIKDDMKYTGDVSFTDHTPAEYAVPLGSLFVDGAGPILSSTAPNLATTDNVGAVVYDNSGEVAEIQFTHATSKTFAGLKVKVIATSSGLTGTEQAVDWSIFVYDADAVLGTVIAQTGVSFTGTTMDTVSNEVVLTLNAAGIAAITGGTSVIHVAVWNNSSNNATLEIKGIRVDEL
jgi:hypothetical protein